MPKMVILMSATNTLPAIHASMLLLQMEFSADGALEEPLTTKIREIPHSNAEVIRQESHMISLAQLNSELPTAVASTATSLLINALKLKLDNSQPWRHATRLAQW
jgi:hypothetical protein